MILGWIESLAVLSECDDSFLRHVVRYCCRALWEVGFASRILSLLRVQVRVVGSVVASRHRGSPCRRNSRDW